MSTLPRAVIAAEKRADEILQEIEKQGQMEQMPQPPVESQDPPTPQPAIDSPPPPQEESWEHRFKVLQGKYNAEVPRFAHENKDLKGRLQSLEDQLEEMKNAKPPELLVKPEEIEQYGEGLIDVARRVAREELASKDAMIAKLKSEIDSVKSVQSHVVQDSFFRSLTEMVPDWEALNADTNFLNWLDGVDDLTGETRQSLLGKAEQQRDPVRAAKFFNTFKKTSQSWAAQSAASMEQQIVPPTNQAPSTPQSKKIWTRAEITIFYDRVRRGTITDADAVAIEADIASASVEGRIR
jgi:cell division septum initiation protein DivIVA